MSGMYRCTTILHKQYCSPDHRSLPMLTTVPRFSLVFRPKTSQDRREDKGAMSKKWGSAMMMIVDCSVDGRLLAVDARWQSRTDGPADRF